MPFLVKGVFCIKNAGLIMTKCRFMGSVKSSRKKLLALLFSHVKQMLYTSKFAVYFANGFHVPK